MNKNGYERYVEIICKECESSTGESTSNGNECNIHKLIDGTYKCENYKRCMQSKCKNFNKYNDCFDSETKH